MSAEPLTAVHRAWLEAIEREHDGELDAWFSGVHQLHQTLVPELPRGPDGVRLALTVLRHTFSPWRVVLDAQLASGQRVMTRFQAQGKHVGPLGAMRPTGAWCVVHGMLLSRIVRNLAYETWLEVDAYRLLQTMRGAMPRREAFEQPREVDDV